MAGEEPKTESATEPSLEDSQRTLANLGKLGRFSSIQVPLRPRQDDADVRREIIERRIPQHGDKQEKAGV
jgi:hypothetical protein